MGIVRAYRLPSLLLLVAAVLALFLGFFFVWVLAPLAAIGIFYLVYLAMRERSQRKPPRTPVVARRRDRLEHEAEARHRELHPDEPAGVEPR